MKYFALAAAIILTAATSHAVAAKKIAKPSKLIADLIEIYSANYEACADGAIESCKESKTIGATLQRFGWCPDWYGGSEQWRPCPQAGKN